MAKKSMIRDFANVYENRQLSFSQIQKWKLLCGPFVVSIDEELFK